MSRRLSIVEFVLALAAAALIWAAPLGAQDMAQYKSDVSVVKSGGVVVSGGSGAPDDADYLVGTANGDLSAEIVVGTSPGGELGGTWGSPTLDDSVAVTSWTLTTAVFVGAITFPDNTRQTFNPGADAAGLNVGSHAGDPGTPSNGDLWYDSVANELTARINGATVALGAGGGAPSTSDYLVGTSDGGLSAEIVVGTSPGGELGGTWASPTIDDSLAVTSWTLTTPTVSGAITLPDGVTQTFNPDATNAGVNIGSVAGVPSSADPGDLWYNSTARENRVGVPGGSAPIAYGGPSFINVWDEMTCGHTSAVTNQSVGSCTGGHATITGGLAGVASIAQQDADDTDRIGQGFLSSNSLNDLAVLASTTLNGIVLLDRFRWRTAVSFNDIANDGEETYILIGAHDAAVATSGMPGAGMPTDGIWFHFDEQDDASAPNWMINVANAGAGAGTTTADSGIAVAPDVWYDLEFWYESGVGVHFLINGTETANSPINTDLPTTITDGFSVYNFKFERTLFADTPNPEVFIDYIGYSVPVSRP